MLQVCAVSTAVERLGFNTHARMQDHQHHVFKLTAGGTEPALRLRSSNTCSADLWKVASVRCSSSDKHATHGKVQTLYATLHATAEPRFCKQHRGTISGHADGSSSAAALGEA